MASVRKRTWTAPNGETKTAWMVDYYDSRGDRQRKHFAKKKAADAFRIDIEGQLRVMEFCLNLRPFCNLEQTSCVGFQASAGVNFYKTRSEHNESAIPPKLSVKAEVADWQGWPQAVIPASIQRQYRRRAAG